MSASKHQNNIQFVRKFMSGNHINEVIVIQALSSYCHEVIENEEKYIKEVQNPIINAHTLLAAVKELHSQLEKHLNN